MASCFCYTHDPDPGSHNYSLGRPQEVEDDWQNLPTGNPADWLLLQSQSDLWQQSLPIPQCCVHSDAQGRVSYTTKLEFWLTLSRQLHRLQYFCLRGFLVLRRQISKPSATFPSSLLVS